ncbi:MULTISPECIES: hypothetical protein [unclassified Bacillus (in: firmicutes)]|uniref:hypothetical protein n=1 Tax=unclassified Bacillus (in: firmicutes) TaxID=185979 RepID=UPI002282165D|nr:hypothetical protein [Bacillus sp. S20C3]MCY8202298.1 hypothetical protein [Bacillus sp. N12A5]MCY8288009.1 hypothetical protein [Bacillus sp. N13C7]MCY8636801.1 hypothetical protein [Bacillus sp. S17B2]MCY8720474.1 hypothetical protein [Bacillus sp. S10C12M]MCY9145855.1 hypothetical protein [Bacillus sp. T9C1]
MNEFEKWIEGRYKPHEQKQKEHDDIMGSIRKDLDAFDEAGLAFEEEMEELAEKTEALLKKHQAQHEPS